MLRHNPGFATALAITALAIVGVDRTVEAVLTLDTTALTRPGRYTVSIVAGGTNYLFEPGCSVLLTRKSSTTQHRTDQHPTPAPNRSACLLVRLGFLDTCLGLD
jgi:hypothetical protein